MKLYLLSIFAIMAVLVLLVVPPPANAQGEGESASEEPPQQPEPPSPSSARPGPFRPGLFRPFLRPFRSNPFNLTGNCTGRPFRPFSVPFFDPFSIIGNFTGRRLPSFFPPRNLTRRPIFKSIPTEIVEDENEAKIQKSVSSFFPISSVGSDDNARPRVQKEGVKASLVREPRGVSF
ncbi:uncharacterized protein [Bactrocera oleae]|uniref:uncharacterized protein isoform X2 n=1 Tax=Bactrocera oleae TaxID=104688 RepID=UPI00387E7517